MKHIILIGEDIVLPFGIFSPNDAWHCSLHFFLPCVCDAEQFQVALAVQVTTLGLSTRWTGHLMDAMLLYPAEGTSIWHGSLGRSRPTSWYILLCSVIGGFWSLHLHICIFFISKKTYLHLYAAILATTQQGGGTADSEHGVESRRRALAPGARWWTLPQQRNRGKNRLCILPSCKMGEQVPFDF